MSIIFKYAKFITITKNLRLGGREIR